MEEDEDIKTDADKLARDRFLADIAAIEAARKSVTPYRTLLQGDYKTKIAKPKKCWHRGKLITQVEWDKLPWEEQHASNNEIRRETAKSKQERFTDGED